MPRRKTKTHPGYEAPFAVRLRELIDDAGIPQHELATYIGVTRQAVSGYSLGTSVPDIDKFEKIADFFNVSTEYLLGRTDIKKADASKQAAAEYLKMTEDAIDIIKGMQSVRFESVPGNGYGLKNPEEPLPEIFSYWLGTANLSGIMLDIWQMICATAQDHGWNKEKHQLGSEHEDAMRALNKRGYLVLSPKQQELFFGQSAYYKFIESLEDLISHTVHFAKEQDHLDNDDRREETV